MASHEWTLGQLLSEMESFINARYFHLSLILEDMAYRPTLAMASHEWTLGQLLSELEEYFIDARYFHPSLILE
jgi:hypothetical protein